MKELKQEPIPEEFNSYEEAGEFWDTHSAADYWDEMEDVECEVDIQSRRFMVTLENEVYQRVEKLATDQHLFPEDFLNKFLRNKLIVNSSELTN